MQPAPVRVAAPAQAAPVRVAAPAQDAPVQPAPVRVAAPAQPAPVRGVVQGAENVANDAAINTTNEPEDAPPDTKHKRGARSNRKAKRQQREEVDTTKTATKPKTPAHSRTSQASIKKKRFRWAKDIENYHGTGNQRSDGEMKDSESSAQASDTSDSDNSSNESMTDPTPPIVMSRSRRSRHLDEHPINRFINFSDSSHTASDTSSSTTSATDIVAGIYHSMLGGVRGIGKKLAGHLSPTVIQTNRREDIASGQKTPRHASTTSSPELSYTSENLRRLKRSGYDPVTVQAEGRGDFGNPLPKKRQTHTSSWGNSPLEHTYRRSRSDSGNTSSDADHQYREVKHAISDATSNAERNKGLSSGRSGNAGTRGVRRCSLELAREKGKIPRSSGSQESKPRNNSEYPKPLFIFRRKNDDGRGPVFAFKNQRDLDELRAQDRRSQKHRSRKHRSRKQRDPSPPHPFDVVVPDTRDESHKRGTSKTSWPAYQRPYVTDENGRSVHDGPKSRFHYSKHG